MFDSTFNAYYICSKNLDNNLIANLDYIVNTLKGLKSRSIIDSVDYLDKYFSENAELAYYHHTINNLRKKYSIDKFIWVIQNLVYSMYGTTPLVHLNFFPEGYRMLQRLHAGT